MVDLSPAPGWYTDEREPAFLRFWTGAEWSSHRKPRPGLPTQLQEQRRRAEFGSRRRIS